MSTELDVIREAEERERVISMYARGIKLTEIQKETGLPRKRVDEYLAQYRDWAQNDKFMISRSREVVLTTDQHYSDIISQFYDAISEADLAGDNKAKMAGLSSVAKIEADRTEFLRKAGMIAENGVGDLVADAEEKQAILVGILQKIAAKYPDIAREIAFELSQVTNKVEPIG